MEIEPLIKVLSDGQVHSGVELGSEVGVSRAAISKVIQTNELLSNKVKVVKGVGYQIPGGLDLLDIDNIKAETERNLNVREWHSFSTIESTNAYLMSQSHLFDNRAYDICIAEQQTAGRGRRGREWLSPYAENVYLSVGFSYMGGVEALSGMSLVMGLAVLDVLNSYGVEPQLKWPNDVMVEGSKIAGILVELKGEDASEWKVVVGIGLNIYMRESDYSNEIDQSWTSLYRHIDEKHNLNRTEIVLRLIGSVCTRLNQFQQASFAYFKDEWSGYDFFRNKEVLCVGRNLSGKGRGIDDQGNYIIEVNGENVIIGAGELSSLRHEG